MLHSKTKFISLLSILLLCNTGVFAPVKAQDKQEEVEVLNNYAQYINESIHALWMMHRELEEFNYLLNKHYKNQRTKLTFENKDFLNLKSAYLTTPLALYRKSKRGAEILPRNERLQLNKHLDKLQFLVDSIKLSRDSLHLYVRKKYYEKDKSLIVAYRNLDRIANCYENFYYQKDTLYQIITTVYDKYKISERNQPYMQNAKRMQQVIAVCKNILRASRQKNDKIIKDEYLSELFQLTSELIHKRAENLRDIPSFGRNNGLDPTYRYNNFIREANAFYQHAQSHAGNDKYDPRYLDKGKNYYYYNYLFLNKYNRYGGGLIKDYNQFIELSDVTILRMIEEPHWFETLYPEGWKSDEAPQITDTIARTYEEPDTTTLEDFAANNLVFLLDVSGSMKRPEKLPLLKKSLKHLLSLMRPEDYVAIVSYSGKAKVRLNSVSSVEKEKIDKAIDNLRSLGGTNVIRGLMLSYKTARNNYIDEGNNRIILATDGDFEISQRVYRKVKRFADRGISITVFYLNKKEDEDTAEKLKEIARLGNGNYIHVKEENAKRMLLKEAQAIRK